jgi:hypothetical protein
MDLDRVRDLILGAVELADTAEHALLDALLEASPLVGIQPVELRRRLARQPLPRPRRFWPVW